MKFLLLSLSILTANLPALAENNKRIALTYDDAPRPDTTLAGEDRAQRLIDELASAGVEQTAFFVVSSRLDSPERLKRIESYASAGHVIGNHSHTHRWFSEVSAEDYLADIDTAGIALKVFENTRPWFRFPYLNEAPDLEKRDAARAGLDERGLMSAYVTVDTYDWHLDALYQQAMKDGRPVCTAALGKLYSDMLVEAANFFDQAARDYLDAVPAQIMLLHENDIAAMFTGDLVAALKADGWEIVTADEAFADPIADILPDTQFLGMGRVAALSRLAGKPGREFTYLAVEEADINAAFETRVIGDC